MPGLLAREPRRGVARAVVGIARGQEQRLATSRRIRERAVPPRIACVAGRHVAVIAAVLSGAALHAARFAGRGGARSAIPA